MRLSTTPKIMKGPPVQNTHLIQSIDSMKNEHR